MVISGFASGVIVGFVLGLVGGGGSILAAPLLVHLVGVHDAHVAIGTSAVAVAVNAVTSLVAHARNGVVKWRCAATFAMAGIVGAAGGSELGKAIDGQKLITLFGVLMTLVGAGMVRSRSREGQPDVRLTTGSARVLLPRLIGAGFATGAASGFFGIGGGFLIVPALMVSTDMPLAMAVSSSLVAVSAFGVTTAVSYASSSFVDWTLAALLIGGGTVGSLLGTLATKRLARHKRALTMTFAVLVMFVGLYVIAQGVRGG